MRNSSRDLKEGTRRSVGGGRSACCVTPNLSCEREGAGESCANVITVLPGTSISVLMVLRGAIVIRTHHIHKNLYITLFLLIIFGPYYYVPRVIVIIKRRLRRILVGLGFLWSVSCIKSIPTLEKSFAVRKSGPDATFNLLFLGLGWPWVGGFVCFHNTSK